jgi:2,3-bisphosphoglycerate-dependent phosphoglycerate mutase
MTRLVLVRHGESNASVARIVGGPRSCTGLSALGRDQAAALAARWARTKEVSADVLISSMYRRAIETAEVLAPALGGLPIEQVHDVGEHFPGEVVDGMSFEQFALRFGLTDWDGDPFEVGFPGGETVAAFQHRIANAFAQIVRDHAGRTIVVVCHGGVIDTAVRRFLQTPPTGLFEIHTLNTSITEFVLVGANRWRMLRYNDAAHLAGLARETPRVTQAAPDVDRLALREVTSENLDEVRAIEVWPGQRQFVSSVERSLVDAHHRGKRAWYRAAYVGERPTGFVMVAEPNQPDENVTTNAWYLWRFLVAGPYQRGGYGRRMLELVCDHIRSLPDTPQELFTSWIDGDGGPAEFYLRFGFEPTGRVIDGEVEARLTRWPASRT